ncbi:MULTISPECIES: FtsK/SpoIIIE domain-containing protein [Arthrobacter]|uniref:FtsK/SpoIIIE domain-containing protein n=2 Tax=Arthrobacter TaxID=1663 RepID=A0ABU9KL74_9MICC|nr:FtsK/SpoIIIE domain-containing protein [Arthrobacter sp. YJM1]MDP5227230.1 FtsK/SpoIIIE domain-containing protein [Arthrobacter sp. YJM1]
MGTRIECTLLRLPDAPPFEPAEPLELSIEFGPGSGGAELAAALRDNFGLLSVSVEGTDLATLQPGESTLRNGCVLVAAERPVRVAPRGNDDGAHLDLVLLSGPDAGASLPLHRGDYHIGRGEGAVPLTDPSLSRRHSRLTVSAEAIRWTDESGSRGTFLDGRPFRGATVLTTGLTFRCGAGTFSIRSRPLWTLDVSSLGTPPQHPESAVRSRPPRRWATGLLALLPLVGSVALAATLGSWPFLAVSVLSGLPFLVSAFRPDGGPPPGAPASTAAPRLPYAGFPRLGELLLAQPSAVSQASPAQPERQGHSDGSNPAPGPWIRLGEHTTAAARSSRRKTHSSGRRQSMSGSPVVMGLGQGLRIQAGHRDYRDFVHGVIAQLARRHPDGAPRILLVGPPTGFPPHLRFLPNVHHCPTWADASDKDRPGPSSGTLLVLTPGSEVPVDTPLSGNGWCAIVHLGGAAASMPGAPVLRLERDRACLETDDGHVFPHTGQSAEFIPDLADARAFEQFCRGFQPPHGSGTPESGPSAEPPTQVSLAGLLPADVSSVHTRWEQSRNKPAYRFPVGESGAGEVMLDLVDDGPHFLVAGTTGSGKSGFLRSLVLSAAAHLSPEDLGLVLVDFKGGATFQDVQRLPHVQGLVTDLGAHELERTLISLRAELQRREHLFREHLVGDWEAWRALGLEADGPLPRICLIIDEFRMMLDHAPDSLAELIRLASVGRSLGLHLVLATQRPQGAIGADIRANIGTCIALRVQSDLDSLDVIGSSHAARLPPGSPGRAILSSGGDRTEFQVAAEAVPQSVRPGEVSIRRWPLTGQVDWPVSAPDPMSPGDTGSLVSLLIEAEAGHRMPRPVLAPPLPRSVEPGEIAAPGALALVDLPAGQSSVPLVCGPGESAAIIGSDTDCSDTARAVLASLLGHCALRLITHDGSAIQAFAEEAAARGGSPASTGAPLRASLDDAGAIAALLQGIGRETSQAGLATGLSRGPADTLLYVESWEALQSILRTSEHFGMESMFQELLRTAASRGLRVIVAGREGLTASRSLSLVDHVIHHPSGVLDDDPRLSRMVRGLPRIPGRVLVRSARLGPGHHMAQAVRLAEQI